MQDKARQGEALSTLSTKTLRRLAITASGEYLAEIGRELLRRSQ